MQVIKETLLVLNAGATAKIHFCARLAFDDISHPKIACHSTDHSVQQADKPLT